MKVECICLDAKNKPEIIPDSLWIVEGQKYNITYIWWMINQGLQGCDLAELNISAYVPYNCFRLDRFGFTEENLLKLIELMKMCTEMKDIDIDKIVEGLTIKKEEEELI
jgi:hypothetical protein